MDHRTQTRLRGTRMAMQVAAIAVGVGGVALAAAEEARADEARDASVLDAVAAGERVSPQGWSCWGAPVSRGPLAPPHQGEDDFLELLALVPS